MQGSGRQQQSQKKFTESKIAAFLAIRPFNAEGLLKESGIRRNGFRSRLESLVSRRIVIRHKYSIQYNPEFYGYAYKNPNQMTLKPPRYGDIYYLLNWSNPETKKLVKYYYYTTVDPSSSNKHHSKLPSKIKSNNEESKRINLEIEGYAKDIVNIEKEIKSYFGKEELHGLILAWAKSIEELRRLGKYDDDPTTNNIVYDMPPDIKAGLPIDTIAQTIVKAMLHKGIWSSVLSREEIIENVYSCLPNKYKHFSESDHHMWLERLKSLPAEQMRKEFEEEVIKTRHISEIKTKYHLSGAKRQIRFSYLDEERGVEKDDLENIKKATKLILDKGHSISDVLIRCSTYNIDGLRGDNYLILSLMNYTELWDVLKKEGFLKDLK